MNKMLPQKLFKNNSKPPKLEPPRVKLCNGEINPGLTKLPELSLEWERNKLSSPNSSIIIAQNPCMLLLKATD